MMREVRHAGLFWVIVASMLACGDDAPVGVSPRTFSVLLAGTLVSANGQGVSGASVTTTAVIPQSSGRDSVGSCRGLAGSTIPAVSDLFGRFSTRVSWIQPGPLCLGIEISTTSGAPGRWAVSLDSVWLTVDRPGAAGPPDTLRVFVVLAQSGVQ
jgi:hypothetical protein